MQNGEGRDFGGGCGASQEWGALVASVVSLFRAFSLLLLAAAAETSSSSSHHSSA